MLKNLFSKKQFQLQRKQPRFVQRWIETGDERCPLAGMWTTLMENQAETTGEADLCGRILFRAFRGCACPLPTLAA